MGMNIGYLTANRNSSGGQIALDAFDKALQSDKCVISWDSAEGTIVAEAM